MKIYMYDIDAKTLTHIPESHLAEVLGYGMEEWNKICDGDDVVQVANEVCDLHIYFYWEEDVPFHLWELNT